MYILVMAPVIVPSASNREKLLEGAIVCLRDRGYAATTARDIVAESGANLASIGYHFGGKEALLNEAVAESTRAWMRSIESEVWTVEPGNASLLLRQVLAATVGRFEELAPYLRSFVESFPPATRSEELRAQMAAAYADVRDAGANLLERAIGDPRYEPGEVRAACSVLIALCDGLILQWLLDPNAVPSIDQLMGTFPLLGSMAEAGTEVSA